MKNQTSQNKLLRVGIIIAVIGFFTIIIMTFLITPNLKNDLTTFTDIREYTGTDSFVKVIGEKLPPPIPSKDILEYKVVNFKGNVLEIVSTYNTYDIITGEKIYGNSNTYFVDRNTRKHMDSEYYFKFPFNVQKENYNLIDPNMEVPSTFVFEGVKYINGLEVYEFSCESIAADLSKAWPEFAPEKIYADQSCQTSIEPITGKTVQFSINWNMYAIQEGKHITIEQGGSETTQFTEFILEQNAKNTKQLFYIYDVVIPTFIVIFFIDIFFISIYKIRTKEKDQIIIKQLEEVKRMNENKIEMLEKQSKQEKFSIIGELSAKISHDIRNPLSIIKMGIELIDRDNEKFSQETKNRIQLIRKAVDRISHQIEDVLGFVRANKLSLESVSLKTILTQSIESLEIPNGIKITVPKSDIISIIDPLQIETVFSNILLNSIQALGESGEIEIKFAEKSDSIEIQIIDSGTGIPEGGFSKIFEPLYTTKQQGTGLGLASCMTIIKNHGGAITVKNNPTTFTITLPKNPKNPES